MADVIGFIIVGVLLMGTSVYLLFFWHDPAIERFERGLEKESTRQAREAAEELKEQL